MSLKFVVWERVKTLPKEKISDQFKFKAFADDKTNATQQFGENAGHFSFSNSVFKRPLFQGKRLTFYHTIPTFNYKIGVLKTYKRKYLLLVFLSFPPYHVSVPCICSSANAFIANFI